MIEKLAYKISNGTLENCGHHFRETTKMIPSMSISLNFSASTNFQQLAENFGNHFPDFRKMIGGLLNQPFSWGHENGLTRLAHER